MYFVFFLVVAAGAYTVMAVADAPTVHVEGGETYSQNDTFTKGGQEYRVSQVSPDGGELTYTNESFQHTREVENGSDISFRGGTYQAIVPNESNASEFTLRQTFNVSERLRQDPNVENQTLEREDGTTYVRYTNGTTQPLGEYLPEPDEQRLSVGDTFQYQGNRTNVSAISSGTVELTWTAPNEQTAELTEGGNVTLGDQQYFAHFEGSGDDARVVLAPTDAKYGEYNNQLQQQAYFQERMNGLWGVIVLSALAAIAIAALAYMPVKG